MNKTNASTTLATTLTVAAALCLGYGLLPKAQTARAASVKQPTAPTAAANAQRARATLAQMPLSFEINRGQFDPEVQFKARGAGYTAFLTRSEAVFILRNPQTSDQAATMSAADVASESVGALPRAEQRAAIQALKQERAAARAAAKSVVRMSLVGANSAAQVVAHDELQAKVNYFRGQDPSGWITAVPTYARVEFIGVYPGVDLVYYGKGRELEYDLVVAPGADARQIGLRFEGAERLEVDAMSGELVVHTAGGGQLRQGKPFLYQEVNGARQQVSGAFAVSGDRVTFNVGSYDASAPLVIDPVIRSFSTYLGGEDDDRAHDVTVDAAGNAYVVGWTQSELFPTKDATQPGNNNDDDEAFVTRFNADGSGLVWSTYLGGGARVIKFDEGIYQCGGEEGAYGVAVDNAGNVYVTGYTFSRDFPTRNAMQPNLAEEDCDGDAFITKLNAAGDQLVFSTYYGGVDGTEIGRGIAVDANQNVYVAGYTNSPFFPTTNPIQPEIGQQPTRDDGSSNYDAFVSKIDATGRFRVYSTYLGGESDDVGLDIALDGTGNAYVTGWTQSTTPAASPSESPSPSPSPRRNFPTTSGALQVEPLSGNTRDAFVTKVNAAGTAFTYSTFLGGSAEDVGWGIAVGADGSAFVGGYTNSGAPTPTPSESPSPAPSPGASPPAFPTTSNAYQQQNAGGYDAFLTRLNPAGSALVYSTYLGGQANEGDGVGGCLGCGARYDGAAVTLDFVGNAYVTGWTESTFTEASPGPTATPVNFPTKNAAQPQPGTNPGAEGVETRDGFAAKLNTDLAGEASLLYSTFLGGPEQDEGQGIAIDPATNAYVVGFTSAVSSFAASTSPHELSAARPVLDAFPVTPGAFQQERAGGEDAFLAEIAGGGFIAASSTDGFIISGRVTRSSDGAPVAGVTITLTRADSSTSVTATNSDGVYFFENLPPGAYTVTPSGGSDVYTPPSQAVEITNENERADFTTAPPPATPTPTPTASPTPSPSPSPNPSPTPSPSPSPSASPGPQPVNLSTRFYVQPDDRVGIGGFIIIGSGTKHVVVRAIGPSLTRFGLVDVLPDPVLEIRDGNGELIGGVSSNDNWRDTQETQLQATGIPPTNDLESAIDANLTPGNYTALVSGKPGTKPTGLAVVEVYDLDEAPTSKMGNLSTRAFVGTGDNIVIAGVVLGRNNGNTRLVFRGLGPSLTARGVPDVVQNPTLELRNAEGVLLISNNDWQDNPTQAAELTASGLAPIDSREAAIAATLPPGFYTALLAGLDQTTGNGIVEIYDRGPAPSAPTSAE